MKPTSIRVLIGSVWLALLLGCVASAQETDGVIKDIDSFTGESSCEQTVTVSGLTDTSITLKNTDGSYQLVLKRSRLREEDVTHNIFGALDGDLLYIKFVYYSDNGVVSFPIADASADISNGLTAFTDEMAWDSEVTVEVDKAFVERLGRFIDGFGRIEYRIASNGEEFDSTLDSNLLQNFHPFFQECMYL